MTAEPTLSQVHADMVERLKHDERLRSVEQEQAAVRAVIADLPRMESRLITAIKGVSDEVRRVDDESSAPKPWPTIVMAVVASVVLVLGVAERLYGG